MGFKIQASLIINHYNSICAKCVVQTGGLLLNYLLEPGSNICDILSKEDGLATLIYTENTLLTL